jgi:hypothetical protein
VAKANRSLFAGKCSAQVEKAHPSERKFVSPRHICSTIGRGKKIRRTTRVSIDQEHRCMTKAPAITLAGLTFLLVGAASPAAAQGPQSCYPYCDFTHYYGPYDYRYLRPGLICYPICGPDGRCSPNPACVGQSTRGRITVRSLSGARVTTTPTTATFYDPSVTAVPGRRRRARRR